MHDRADIVAENFRGLRVEDEGLSTPPEPLLDYIQHFGLTQPPFEKGLGGFFTAHGRKSLLTQLVHLLHFSDNVSSLVGPSGVGKSSLLQEIYTQLSGEDYVFLRTGVELGTPSDLLFSLAKTIGLAVSEQDPLSRLRARLNEWSEFSGGSLQAYILVDDADLLAEQTLETLLDLVSPSDVGTCWHLLLVGPPNLADRLQRIQHATAEPAQTFSMPEVSQEFVADYLAFRLADAGFDGISPFSETVEESIWLTSGGDLNRVNTMAEIHLLEQASAPITRSVSIPWLHLSALVALCLLLTIAWWGYEDDSALAVAAPALVAVSTPKMAVVEGVTETKRDDRSIAAPSVSTSPESESVNLPVIPSASENSETSSDVKNDPLMATGGLVKSASIETPILPAASLPAERPFVASVNASATKPATAPKSRDYAGDEILLLALPSQHFTLQVLAAESKEGVELFIKENSSQPLRWYSTRRSGKPWYVVVLGDFDSADQARQATQRLPKNLQKAGPWPRTLASVQQQINEN